MNRSAKVEELIKDCLNGSEDGAILVNGIVRNFGFSPEKIASHKREIRELLNEMPLQFHKATGGGWSFLNLCMDKDGEQWGEQSDCESLIVLGIAAKLASYVMPRDMWSILPGGVPYIVFDTTS
jgi:hypothetical protein